MARDGLVPAFLIRQLHDGRTSGYFQASVLFLDISGFTAMTGELAAHGKRGAEVLSQSINRVFGPVVELVGAATGFVSTFAGDALTAIFPSAGVERVVEIAERIAVLFDREYVQATPLGEFTLDMKIGIAEGRVDWGIVGTGGRLAGYFRGEAVDGAALAEHAAGAGEIILPVETAGRLPGFPDFEAAGGGHVRLPRRNPAERPQSPARAVSGRPPGTDGSLQERFIPKAVSDSGSPGEFRAVAGVFVAFDDPGDQREVARTVEPILELAGEFGGYFNLLDFGDKGGVVLVVFGAPRSHGDLAHRAAVFTGEVVRRCGSRVRAGFTVGTAFAGFVGSARRATYTVLGPTVNLAARLALMAEPGSALTAGAAAASLSDRVRPEGSRTLKGIPSPVAVYRIVTEEGAGGREADSPSVPRRPISARRHSPAMPPERAEKPPLLAGREEELGRTREWGESLAGGSGGGLLVISGEAGAGKSVLARAAFDALPESLSVAWIYADTILRKSLNPFKGFLEWCFRAEGLPVPRPGDPDLAGRLRSLIERVSGHGEETDGLALREGMAALVLLLGHAVEDRDFQQLDAQARFERGVRALTALLNALAHRRRLLLVVEDAHALDADSATVIERFLRSKPPAGRGAALVMRSVDAPGVSALAEGAGVSVTRIALGGLPVESLSDLIAGELHGPPDRSLTEFILRRVGSNPFYAKELASYLVGHGMVRRGERGYRLTSSEVALPQGISTLVLTRFDSLSPEVQAVARVAALLGSQFRVRELERVVGPDLVRRAMALPDSRSLWSDDGDGLYRFRQELVRETIEHTQLDGTLQETHARIAEALKEYAKGDPGRYADLAHHTDLAGQEREARRYLKLAAEHATTNFKNEKAIEFYRRLIDRATSIDEKIEAHGAISEVYNVVGNWHEAESSLVYAIGLCVVARDVRRRVRLMTKLGALYQNRGHRREAASVLETSVGLARRLADHGLLADALIEHGRIQSGRGDLAAASVSLDEAIAESRLEGDVRREGLALYYRGLIYRDQNRYDDALRCYDDATARFTAAKDDRLLTYPLYDMGVVLLYTGATEESRRRFEEVIRVYERIGYRSGTAAALLNLGVLEDRKGNFESAQRYFAQSREIADDIGEKLASGYAVFSMGATYSKMRDHRRALFYLKQSYDMLKALEARTYYGYPLSFLACLYADTGEVDLAVRACYLHLRNEKDIGSDVENGRAFLGLALALSGGEPASKLARDLVKRIARAVEVEVPSGESFFRLAISRSSASGYVNTLIPALHRYGEYLLGQGRIEEANLNLEKAYRTAIDANWEGFVAQFQSDYAELAHRFIGESPEGNAVRPAD